MDRPLGRNNVFRAWVASAALSLPACSDVSAPSADHGSEARALNRSHVSDGKDQQPLPDPLVGRDEADQLDACPVTLASHVFAPPPVPEADTVPEPSNGETPAAQQEPDSAQLRRLPAVRDQHVVTSPAPAADHEPGYLIWRLPAVDETDQQGPVARDAGPTIRRLPPVDDPAAAAAPPAREPTEPVENGPPELASSEPDGPCLFGPSPAEFPTAPDTAAQQPPPPEDPALHETAASTAPVTEPPDEVVQREVVPRVLAEPDDDDPLALLRDADTPGGDGPPDAPGQDAVGSADATPDQTVWTAQPPATVEESEDVASSALPSAPPSPAWQAAANPAHATDWAHEDAFQLQLGSPMREEPSAALFPRPAAPDSWTAVSVPVRSPLAAVEPSAQDSTQDVIERRVVQLSSKAEGLASRGAYYAARAEVIRALRTITQSLDTQQGGTAHSDALARAMRAFQEAGDFAPRGSDLEANLNLAQIVTGHRTPIMQDVNLEHMAPLTVQQRYLEYAQEQFAEACGNARIGSFALYALARIYAVMEHARLESQVLCLPKAVALHQAALLVDAGNVRAANELGVLLAQFGQLEDARRVLLHALSIQPEPEIWMNVAVVHQRLGELRLAREAHQQGTLLMASRQSPSSTTRAGTAVQWVDPQTFSQLRPGPGQ